MHIPDLVREPVRLVRRFKEELQHNGIRAAVHQASDTAYGYLAFPWIRATRHTETFMVFHREFRYFRHPYNRAWMNERTVELALANEFLRDAGPRTLEIGNVTHHYRPHSHEVLDKYESFPGVRNIDVVDLSDGPYDAILSISTLEHVGWDEQPRDPEKVERAMDVLIDNLSDSGQLLFTCPLGYNPHLDELAFSGRLPVGDLAFLRRLPRNRWTQVAPEEVRGIAYGRPYPNANAIVVGVVGWPRRV